MPNVMVVDGALNCAYDIYEFTPAEFEIVFPGEGQDVAFIEDLEDGGIDLGFLTAVWKRPVAKKHLRGLDGILFVQLYEKRMFYPSLRDSDLDHTGRPFSLAALTASSTD